MIIRSLKRTRRLILILVVLLIGISAIGTYAFFNGQGHMDNGLKIGSVTTQVLEAFDGHTKKHVSIRNSGKSPAYIRVAIKANWIDSDGNIVLNPSGEYDLTPDILDENWGNTTWFKGSDGFYYCKTRIAPNDFTPTLLERGEIVSQGKEGLRLQLDIVGSGIQGTRDAIADNWKAVRVDSFGHLERAE